VVALTGATCSGKSTVAKLLAEAMPDAVYINQDDFYYPESSAHHIQVEGLEHINWDIVTAVDMASLAKAVKKAGNVTGTTAQESVNVTTADVDEATTIEELKAALGKIQVLKLPSRYQIHLAHFFREG